MIKLKVVSLSWKCPDDEFVLLSIMSLLREEKLIGIGNKYGGPDEIMFFSGGPVSDVSTKSILAGPPNTRYVTRQPGSNSISPNKKKISPLSGEIELGSAPPNLIWSKQVWSKNSNWNNEGFVSGKDISESSQKFEKDTHPLTKEQKKTDGFLPGQHCVALSYDLVQWTQPWKFFNPPKEGSLLGLVWQIDRWIIHNKATKELELIGIEGDLWFKDTSKVIADLIANYQQNFVWPDMTNGYNKSNEQSNHTDYSHEKIVDRVKKAIKKGELYQLNFGRKWFGNLSETPWKIMLRLLSTNPAPWSNWICVHDLKLAICSSSPELLLSANNGRITTRPIKGTTSRDKNKIKDKENMEILLTSPKERAEHLMLVDLERNDLSMVCYPGTVKRSKFQIESYTDVHHLVSEIEGKMKEDQNIWSAVQAIFPGGSITGCPKTVTIASIDELEKEPRSFWTGSIGYVDSRRNIAQLNILIRTLEARLLETGEWSATVQAGGGLVIDSNSKSEVEESKWKAKSLRIAAGWLEGDNTPNSKSNKLDIKLISTKDNYCEMGQEIGEISIWPEIPYVNKKRVLFIDNLDSFSWNIIHGLSELGSDVCVINGRLKESYELSEILEKCNPSHIVIGPGPGKPEYSELSMSLVKEAISLGLKNKENKLIPILGICLGHQAIGIASGLKLIENPNGAVHGTPNQILHDGTGLFKELKQGMKMTRYHSLVLVEENIKSKIKITARDNKTNSIMGIEHNLFPIFGVQFHPESAESESGYRILNAFLQY